MATSDPHNDQSRDRGRRDLLLFLILLLVGFACILATAEIAVRPSRLWQASANMLSELKPDEESQIGEAGIQPLRPEALTPLPWDQLLTPVGTPTVIPLAIVGPPPGTPTEEVAVVPTPSPSATAALPTPTSTSTPTSTPTASPTATATPTATPSPTPTSSPTSTPTPTPTNTPPPPPTRTSPPPPTNTPTPTNTPGPPAPIAYAIIPNTSVNTTTVSAVVSGANFQPGCSVQLGTVPLTVTGCLPTTISVTVPVDILASFYDLTVTNPDTQWGTLSNAYTATNPVPLVTSVAPVLSAASTTNLPVTITGDYFRNTGTPGGLQAFLNGTLLTNIAYIGPTTLSAEVPFSAPGLGLGIYDLTVTNPGPTDPSGTLIGAFTVYTYTTTCEPVPLCNNAVGQPDDAWAQLNDTDVITLDFGTGINDGPGYDMVFYERPNAPGIQLDYVTIEIGDGSTWHKVFEWNGDVAPGQDVSNTNIASYANDVNGELDNEPIQSADLYPGGLVPYNTGIAIEIGAFGPGPFRWVRISNPGGGGDPAEVDAIVRLH